MTVKSFLKVAAMIAVACGAVATTAPTHAGTVAHWRFEAGPTNTNVAHGTPNGVFDGTIPDVSGNGNSLSVWEFGGGAGYAYRTSVPAATVPALGALNNFSVKNTGGGPAMFTTSSASNPSGINAETITPIAFTVEASYKPETGGFRTVVGRDARNVGANADFAALYLQVRPNNSVGIQFTDISGQTTEAFSAPGLIQGFDWPTDNEGTTGTWYNLAAVCDGTTLTMYVNNVLVATTVLGAPSTGLAIGSTSGGDWHAGEWSVGRGLYAGGHGDRAYGFIDEVRISDSALAPTQFLFAPVPEPASAALALVAIVGLALGRRRA